MATHLFPEPQTLDRRTFLKTGAAGGAALLIGFHSPRMLPPIPRRRRRSRPSTR